MCPSENKQIKKGLIEYTSLPKTHARGPQKSNKNRRIHLFTCFHASLTLEAAVVIPFTAVFLALILFFFQVLQVETEVQEALFYAGRMTAVESSAVENQTALWGTAELYLQKELQQYSLPGNFVVGGNAGVLLASSDFSDDVIDLEASYTVRFPLSFFSWKGIRIVQHSCNHKWNGKDPTDGSGEEADDEYVYYTDYGTVYHRSLDCSYLNLSTKATSLSTVSSLRSSDGSKYYACPLCGASKCTGGTVYYTTYGTNYHTSLSCSGLKRSIHTAKLSEVSGRLHACSKCGGE